MDWESLTEKLRNMGVRLGMDGSPQGQVPKKRPVETIIAGRDLDTIFGPVFSAETWMDTAYLHGKSKLLPAWGWSRLAEYSRHPQLGSADMQNFIFLDTETTGLSGGTGTMAFMVGAARFEQNTLHLEQFFLRNPAEEAAMLAALERFCDGMEAVVTYNGKAFDIPILNTRYILQSFISPFEDLPHFDLLALTRRIWKARLERCNLGVIEKEILGLIRSETDIPGYLVPEYYRDYLQTGDAEPLKGIFYHNQQDVVSLAALFAILADLLEEPSNWENNSIKDFISLGSVMEKLGNKTIASELYQKGLSLGGDDKRDLVKAFLLQGNMAKKQGDWSVAQACWEEAARLGSSEAMIDLAKFYEHVAKDYQKAIDYAQLSIQASSQDAALSLQRPENIQATRRRVARLLQKKK